MSQPTHTGGRLRAYLQFLAAIIYFFGALAGLSWRSGIRHRRLVPPRPPDHAGISAFGRLCRHGFLARSPEPPHQPARLPKARGLAARSRNGPGHRLGSGAHLRAAHDSGRGIAIALFTQGSSWGWFVVDAAFFAAAALVEEIAYRGYAFQCFIRAVGPTGATLGLAAIYAIMQALNPGASRVSFIVALAFSSLLSIAYLRTRALWVSWGLNFGWKATQAILFGLVVSGISSHSHVVIGDPMGPLWLTGGGYGLEGSWLALIAFLIAIPVLYRATRDLDFRYNVPVFVPGGIPVDLDAAARAQHDAAMGPAAPVAPAAPGLVQIETPGAREPGTK